MQFLTLYYSPWIKPFRFISKENLYRMEKQLANWISDTPGWGENFQLHSKDWAQQIKKNMDLAHYPNHLQRAIMLSSGSLRMLPSSAPSYENPRRAGQGYPFDNLQVSYIGANEPVYIVQTSQNKAWDLIITNSDAQGWVHSDRVAPVSSQFIQQWHGLQRQYYLATDDGSVVTSHDGQFYFLTRLGEIYPRVQRPRRYGEILVATRDAHDQAVIQYAHVSNQHIHAWPLVANSNNLARMLDRFLGKPYGWGGLYGYRDCSATVRDLYAAFAIWMPRHSSRQAANGTKISLLHLNTQQKKQRLIEKGIPLFTLLMLPGHIMIYAGLWHHHIMVFHDKWGLHTKNPKTHQLGRLIIGKTILAPLNIGEGRTDVPITLLSRLVLMTYVVPSKALVNKRCHLKHSASF